jgi:hypothetical protein
MLNQYVIALFVDHQIDLIEDLREECHEGHYLDPLCPSLVELEDEYDMHADRLGTMFLYETNQPV